MRIHRAASPFVKPPNVVHPRLRSLMEKCPARATLTSVTVINCQGERRTDRAAPPIIRMALRGHVLAVSRFSAAGVSAGVCCQHAGVTDSTISVRTTVQSTNGISMRPTMSVNQKCPFAVFIQRADRCRPLLSPVRSSDEAAWHLAPAKHAPDHDEN